MQRTVLGQCGPWSQPPGFVITEQSQRKQMSTDLCKVTHIRMVIVKKKKQNQKNKPKQTQKMTSVDKELEDVAPQKIKK